MRRELKTGGYPALFHALTWAKENRLDPSRKNGRFSSKKVSF